MKLIKGFLAAVATLIIAVLAGSVAAGIYSQLKYPDVPVEERDVFFDIGLVFFLGMVAVMVGTVVIWVLHWRWHAGRALLRAIIMGTISMVLSCFLLLEAALRFPIYFFSGTAALIAGWCFLNHWWSKRER